MIRTILIGMAIFIFSGCSLKDVSKPIAKYSIYNNDKIEKSMKSIDKILEIEKLKAPQYLQNNNIWYKTSSHQTSPYLYSKWNRDFVGMMNQNIADTIYDSGIFMSTFARYSKIKADLLLEGEIVEAIQKINSDSADISFILRLYLLDKKDSKLLGSKEFAYTNRCKEMDAHGAIQAYDDINKKLNRDVITWLKELTKEN